MTTRPELGPMAAWVEATLQGAADRCERAQARCQAENRPFDVNAFLEPVHQAVGVGVLAALVDAVNANTAAVAGGITGLESQLEFVLREIRELAAIIRDRR